MADSVVISLAAKSMEGVAAADPKVTVDIMETSPISRRVSRQIVSNFNGQVTLNLPMPDGFPVWQVIVSFSRYDAVTGFFFQPRANPSPDTFQMQVTRLPTAWTPRFTSLAALNPTRFSPFKNVVAVSSNVDLKNGPAVGDLNANYDALADSAQIQGKTALLNLFSVLTDEQDPVDNVPWFSHVKKFLRLDQERFVGLVEPALFENVQTILNGLNGPFKNQGYFTEPPADLLLHLGNLPPPFDDSQNIQQMITVKKDYEQGNLQLTLAHEVVAGQSVHLLDCDLDENRNIILHSLDVVKHLFNGGTSPISMHEYIVEDSAQHSANGIAIVDLGYQLV